MKNNINPVGFASFGYCIGMAFCLSIDVIFDIEIHKGSFFIFSILLSIVFFFLAHFKNKG